MFSNYFKELAKEHNVKLLCKEEYVIRGRKISLTPDQAASIQSINKVTGKALDRAIIIHPECETPTIAMYHEFGHLLHPRGYAKRWELDSELAADEWALLNYNGHHHINLVIMILKKAIMTYINGGCNVASRRFEAVSQILGVHDKIVFIGE